MGIGTQGDGGEHTLTSKEIREARTTIPSKEVIEALQKRQQLPDRPGLVRGIRMQRIARLREVGPKTRKEKVLICLADEAERGLRGGWTAGHVLCSPNVGGSEGLRRLRELRDDGWEIEMRKVPKLQTRDYRLVLD